MKNRIIKSYYYSINVWRLYRSPYFMDSRADLGESKMKRAWRKKHNNNGRVTKLLRRQVNRYVGGAKMENRNAALALCLETRENDRHQRQSRRWWRDSSQQLLARVDDHRLRVSGVPLSSLVTTSPIVLESRFQRIPRSFRITTYESMIITRWPPPGFTRYEILRVSWATGEILMRYSRE